MCKAGYFQYSRSQQRLRKRNMKFHLIFTLCFIGWSNASENSTGTEITASTATTTTKTTTTTTTTASPLANTAIETYSLNSYSHENPLIIRSRTHHIADNPISKIVRKNQGYPLPLPYLSYSSDPLQILPYYSSNFDVFNNFGSFSSYLPQQDGFYDFNIPVFQSSSSQYPYTSEIFQLAPVGSEFSSPPVAQLPTITLPSEHHPSSSFNYVIESVPEVSSFLRDSSQRTQNSNGGSSTEQPQTSKDNVSLEVRSNSEDDNTKLTTQVDDIETTTQYPQAIIENNVL
ncbi:hypothetical protein ABEB36_004821 [Hypothenemus hampei]|uniref:Uncharacterized protein n=1 Tax=Hypothenemus hampei TaxID=57062 RepID=A0ABD1EZ02_HYPHA